MIKTLFRTLGTLHGLAGLVTLGGVIYFISRGAQSWPDTRSLASDPVGTVGGLCVIFSLIACMAATWMRPEKATLFAWIAAFAYIGTAILTAFLQSGGNSFPSFLHGFYYSAAVRLLAAVLLGILAKKLGQRSNNSFKPNPLRSFKTPSGSSGGSA